jgi:tetratricopeptide (TPR) repeat protein
MLRRLLLLAAASLLAMCAYAQSPGQSQAPPRSDDRTPGESSSKDTRIDLSPPAGDAKMHPNSGVADDVLEMHPYDPHKAEKNIEVGDYYYKMKNYRAAESRYQEALEYKPNDAEATYKLGVSQEIQGKTEEALDAYQGYLKILPDGPHAEEAKTAIERIKNPDAAKSKPESKKEKKKKEKSK